MIEKIKHRFRKMASKRALRKQIKNLSLEMQSIEIAATDYEWEQLNLKPKYKAMQTKIRALRNELEALC